MIPFQKFKKELIRYGLEYFNLFYSSYRGIVVDNKDPENLGRLKVRCPGIFGEQIPDYWAWPKVSYAGNGTGFFAIPEINDGVYIECEGGNSKYLLWSGGWWARNEVPSSAQLPTPTNKVWQTKSGHRIELDDTPGSEKVRITDKNGSSILLRSSDGNKEDTITGAWNVIVNGKASIKADIIELDGGTDAVTGLVTGASICHFTGTVHTDVSQTVKASK